MIEVQWLVPDEQIGYPDAIKRAIGAALTSEGLRGDVCVRVVSEEDIRSLNRDFRQVDAVTDVLTFPEDEGDSLCAPPDCYAGDIAICFARASEQAVRYGHSLLREISFLAVHGALHLAGYDHMNPADEAVMFRRQDEILNELKVNR